MSCYARSIGSRPAPCGCRARRTGWWWRAASWSGHAPRLCQTGPAVAAEARPARLPGDRRRRRRADARRARRRSLVPARTLRAPPPGGNTTRSSRATSGIDPDADGAPLHPRAGPDTRVRRALDSDRPVVGADRPCTGGTGALPSLSGSGSPRARGGLGPLPDDGDARCDRLYRDPGHRTGRAD